MDARRFRRSALHRQGERGHHEYDRAPGGGACCLLKMEGPPAASDGARFTDKVSEVIMNTIAHQVVARDRKVAAPRGPKAVWLPAPPKAPAKSAAEPLCNMMTITSTKQTATCSVTKINVIRQPTQIRAIATSKDNPHFVQDDIQNSIIAAARFPPTVGAKNSRLRRTTSRPDSLRLPAHHRFPLAPSTLLYCRA